MSTVGGLRPEGISTPSNPYQVRVADSLDQACAATGLTDAELAEMLGRATDVSIPTAELGAWRTGQREFPAWVIPALSDAAGLEQRRGRWVRRRGGVARASLPVTAVLVGMAVAGLVWGSLASHPAPAGSGLASRIGTVGGIPASRSWAGSITPSPTAAAGSPQRGVPVANATPAGAQTPPALSAGTMNSSGTLFGSGSRLATPTPTPTATPAATPEATPVPTPVATPTLVPATPAPTLAPVAPSPSPSPIRGIVGGLLGQLGL
ncbi:MAG TPA: hypothetical protein VIA06_07480 [Candidatus Dormibacteraeota bacterium]|nr:hypothetical protein [Candidatus Dormibacteraeota bacterium]